MPSPATHLRAPLLWLLLPLMAGLAAAKLWPPPAFGLWPLLLAAGSLGVAAIWLAPVPGIPARVAWGTCLSLAGGLGGFVLLHARQPQLHERTERPPREVTVTLAVTQIFPAAPSARSLTGLGRIVATGRDDRELTGRRVYFSVIRKISVPPERSGCYTIRGVIETLPHEPAEADFNDYLDNLGIRQKLTRAQILREEQPPGWFPRFLRCARNRLEDILKCGLQRHPQTVSLYLGMLLGEKAVLSDEQQNAFTRSGTFHIFCIAGLHVGVIAIALDSMLRLLRVPRRPAAVVSLLLLGLYVQITGANTPATRAYLMIAFWLAARVFRLPGNGLAALTASALVMLLLDPLQLFSTGYQMSYSVVTALVVMSVPLAEKWRAWWQPFSLLPKPNWRWYHHAIDWSGRWLLGSAAACWGTFLASAPSCIGYFHVFSPGAVLANLVIIPLALLAIVGGFLSLVAGLAGLLSLSALFNSAAAVIIILMEWLVRHGTAVPGVYFTARFTQAWMVPVSLVFMTTVLLAGVAGGWSRRYGGFWPPAVALGLIVILGVKFV
jgi:competence protein ComEC